MKTLGICFGASTIQCVVLRTDATSKTVQSAIRITHEGMPKETLLKFFESIDIADIDRLAVTGRNLRKNVSFTQSRKPLLPSADGRFFRPNIRLISFGIALETKSWYILRLAAFSLENKDKIKSL